MKITKARKKQVKIKMGFAGISGSGKTMSALRIATGLVSHLPQRTETHDDGSTKSRILLIDTENESASLYADKFDFDTISIEPPFTVQKYIDALKLSVSEKYDVCVIDSITHEWAGEGGLLDKKDKLDSADRKKGFNNWKPIGNEHNVFMNAILQSDIHVFATMRSKVSYIVENEGGKQTPKKAGLAPIQRDGIEYEFTTLFECENSYAVASKDRTNLWFGQQMQITEDTGRQLAQWLSSGDALTDAEKQAQQQKFNESTKPQTPPPTNQQQNQQQQNRQQQPQGDNNAKMKAFFASKSLTDLKAAEMVVQFFNVPQDFNKVAPEKLREFCLFVNGQIQAANELDAALGLNQNNEQQNQNGGEQ